MSINAIMIASDLSERSDRALRRGLSIAEAVGARVSLVSIVDESLPRDMAADLAAKSRDHLTATAKGDGNAVDVDIVIETGDPVTRLVEIANEGGFDLVVAGRHRKRPVFDALQQTTVERLVSRALKPVLLAVEAVHEPYAQVFAPVAFSPACHRAVSIARSIAPEAALRILHVWSAPFEGLTGGKDSGFSRSIENEVMHEAKSWAQHMGEGCPDVELLHGSLGAIIQSEIIKGAPDLIAVGAHTRSLSFTGLGSFTAEMLRDPPADLLVAGAARG